MKEPPVSTPFPGMDPYLESPTMWEDFHNNLATEIQAQLAPLLQPRYLAVLEPRVVYDEVFIQQTQIVKPDVAITRPRFDARGGSAVAVAPAPLVGQLALEVPVRLQRVVIRETATGVLVTVIEILSPINKRPGQQGFTLYVRKRRDLLRTEVHLLEIDLLRAGQRPPLVTPLPEAPYFIFLSRGNQRPSVEIWPLHLHEPIPLVAAPLLAPDPDVPLDVGRAIHTIYDRLYYQQRINYQEQPPKPDLTPEDAAWVDERLRVTGYRR